jgi:hypothetical protein
MYNDRLGESAMENAGKMDNEKKGSGGLRSSSMKLRNFSRLRTVFARRGVESDMRPEGLHECCSNVKPATTKKQGCRQPT